MNSAELEDGGNGRFDLQRYMNLSTLLYGHILRVQLERGCDCSVWRPFEDDSKVDVDPGSE